MARAACDAVGPGSGHVERVVGGAVSGEFCVDPSAACDGVVPSFQYEHARALAHDEAVAGAVEGAAGAFRVRVAGGHGADEGERAEAEGREGRLDTADDGDVGAAIADQAPTLADGDGAGGAGHGVGGVGPGEAELDGDGAAGGALEGVQGNARVDAADAAGVEVAGLGLGVGEATERGAELDGDPVGFKARGVESGVFHGEAGCGDGEVPKSVEALRQLGIHVGIGVEVIHLSRNAGAPGAGVEARDGRYG
jgi:hypothetical protein